MTHFPPLALERGEIKDLARLPRSGRDIAELNQELVRLAFYSLDTVPTLEEVQALNAVHEQALRENEDRARQAVGELALSVA